MEKSFTPFNNVHEINVEAQSLPWHIFTGVGVIYCKALLFVD